MLAGALRVLYGYNQWATGRVLDAATGLTAEQWLASGSAGRGSVRDTLVHVLDAQWTWLARWDGSLAHADPHRLTFNRADFPDVAAVRAVWMAVDQATQAFVDGLNEADVARFSTYTYANGVTYRQPLWQMMLHVANHGTQHRSEVAAMLTGFGCSPGDLDMLFYFPDAGER